MQQREYAQISEKRFKKADARGRISRTTQRPGRWAGSGSRVYHPAQKCFPHSQARFNRVSAGGRRRRGRQRMRWLDGITDSMDVSVNSGSWWWTGRPGVLQFMGSQRVGNEWATEQKWTEQIHWTSHHIRTCCPGMGKVQGFSRFHKPKLNYL